jgi:hypothetical protein
MEEPEFDKVKIRPVVEITDDASERNCCDVNGKRFPNNIQQDASKCNPCARDADALL